MALLELPWKSGTHHGDSQLTKIIHTNNTNKIGVIQLEQEVSELSEH